MKSDRFDPKSHRYIDLTIASLCRALDYDLYLAGIVPVPVGTATRADYENRLDYWISFALFYARGVK